MVLETQKRKKINDLSTSDSIIPLPPSSTPQDDSATIPTVEIQQQQMTTVPVECDLDFVKTFKIKILRGENIMVELQNGAGKQKGNPFVRIKAKTKKEIKVKNTKAKPRQINPTWEAEFFTFHELIFPVHCACFSSTNKSRRKHSGEEKSKEELIGQFLIERPHVPFAGQLVHR